MFNFDSPLVWGSVTIAGIGELDLYYGVTFDPEQGTIVSGISCDGVTVFHQITRY